MLTHRPPHAWEHAIDRTSARTGADQPRREAHARERPEEHEIRSKVTYSSRMKLPTEMPPQLMPAIKLPAALSRRLRFTWSRLGLAMEMGLAPALTNESCRVRLEPEPNSGPVVILTPLGMEGRNANGGCRTGGSGSAGNRRDGGGAPRKKIWVALSR